MLNKNAKFFDGKKLKLNKGKFNVNLESMLAILKLQEVDRPMQSIAKVVLPQN